MSDPTTGMRRGEPGQRADHTIPEKYRRSDKAADAALPLSDSEFPDQKAMRSEVWGISSRTGWPSGMRWANWEIAALVAINMGSFAALFHMCIIVSQRFGRQMVGLRPSTWALLSGFLPYNQDDSDIQWRVIRSGLFPLTVVATVHLTLGKRLVSCCRKCLSGHRAIVYRALWHLLIGLLLTSFLHQAGLIFSLSLVVFNYAITTIILSLSSDHEMWSRVYQLYTWVFAIGILVSNYYFEGYRFAWISPSLAPLDEYKGIYSWYTAFNFVSLRIVSFNLDRLWSAQGKPSTRSQGQYTRLRQKPDKESPAVNHRKAPIYAGMRRGSPLYDLSEDLGSERSRIGTSDMIEMVAPVEMTAAFPSSGRAEGSPTRVAQQSFLARCVQSLWGWRQVDANEMSSSYLAAQESHLSSEEYCLLSYLAYVYYPPLYLAGPICSFNAWASQMNSTSRAFVLSRAKRLGYALEWLATLLVFELYTHYSYITALLTSAPNKPMWTHLSVLVLGAISYASLLHLYLKLLLTWRFFRLWALCDNLNVPENMTRCVYDNYCMMVFWKSWHRSYNQWLLRYLYIPLGGSRGLSLFRRIFNIALVFTYVALWHDISLRLFWWSWLIILGFLPELALRGLSSALTPGPQFMRRLRSSLAIRHVICLLTTCNVIFMAIANLVGFTYGVQGVRHIIAIRPGHELTTFFLVTTVFLFLQQNLTLYMETERDAEILRLKNHKNSQYETDLEKQQIRRST